MKILQESLKGCEELRLFATIKISLLVGWGPGFKRANITQCPMWMTVKISK